MARVNSTVRDTYAVLAVAIIILGWFLITYQFASGFIFFFLLVASLIIYWAIEQKWGHTKEPIIGYRRENVLRALGYGALAGGGFILLFGLPGRSLAMGLPFAATDVKLPFDQRFFVVSVLAPIIEEPLFRGGALTLFFNGVYDPRKRNAAAALWVGSIATSFAFAFYHLNAYGSAAQYALFGAFFFSMTMSWVAVKTRSVVGTTLAHAMVNTFLYATKFVVVG